MAHARHPSRLPPEALLAECTQRFVRRSGPGGQNRNKVETGVILLHHPTATTAEANERRTQGDNRTAALFRLRVKLALGVRVPFEEGGPSPLWRSRCRSGRIAINPAHDDFPALLAEALDALAAAEMDVKRASACLGCSPSQLVKLLKAEPRAFLALNAARVDRGEHPLA